MRSVLSPIVQSIQRALSDGVTQAATLVPLLFVLHAADAQAQLPRAQAAPTAMLSAPVTIDSWQASAPLALASRHMDIRVNGTRASVRTLLVYRNDGTVPVSASYLLGAGARFLTEMDDGGCGDDASPVAAEFAEVGEPLLFDEIEVTVDPGETITVELTRAADLFVRGTRHRLVLPVIHDERALFTPEFSARVDVRTDRPIAALASATHGGAVSGLGQGAASLDIANGRAYTSRFIAVEFETGEPEPIVVAANAEPQSQVNARSRR